MARSSLRVWEVDFLAIVPTFFPYLAGQLDLATQLWNGIISHLFVYGPALGIYVIVVRPGVIDDWRAVGPPAGTFAGPAARPRLTWNMPSSASRYGCA